MTTYTLYNAKTHLSSLVDKVLAGEEVIIAKGKTPLVKLVSLPSARPVRKFGSMRGLAKTDDAFFEPLPTDELDQWDQ
jgi:antitoxin (DNA-binding transcriptional repressor) of toxin-antitoxin stability system